MNTTLIVLLALTGLAFLFAGIWIGRQMSGSRLAAQETRLRAEWETERQRLHQEAQDKIRELALSRQECEQSRALLSEEKRQVEASRESLEQLRGALAESAEKLGAAQAVGQGLQTRLTERDAQIQSGEKQQAELRTQMAQLQAQVESQKEALGKAQEQQVRVDQLMADLGAARAELDKLRQQANEDAARIAQLSTAADKDQERIQERDTRVVALQKELEIARQQLDQAARLQQEQRARIGQAEAEEQQHARTRQQLADHEQALRDSQAALADSRRKLAELETARAKDAEAMADKLALLETNKQQLKQEFENLAHQIFESKQQHFTQQSQQGLDTLLKPFKEQLESFRKRVDEVHTNTVEGQTSMKVELEKLRELNTRINDEAANLTQALKGDKKLQGTWGEQKVDLLLQQAGLRKDFEYTKEENFKDDDGQNRRPDFVVKLPEGKHIIIDSKMSLVAYTQYVAAETEDERQTALKAHLKALRGHVDELSSRKYPALKGMDSPDFVFLFVGVEPAYLLAAERDPALFQYAYENGIAIVTATTLLPVLRVVANLWVIQRQNQTTRELADQAARVYDKLRVFVDKMVKLGEVIDKAQLTYRDSFNTLKDGQGSLTKTVHKFVDLGVKVTRQLPPTVLVEDLPSIEPLQDPSPTAQE